MANTILTPTIVAKESLLLLDNMLVAGNRVYRGYEDEFAGQVNGYKKGSSLTIRKPTAFTVRSGATASAQDVTEGSTTVTVNTQIGVDFKFTTQQLTQNIGELSERVLKPAMIQLANKVDRDVLSTTLLGTYNSVGSFGTSVSTWAKFGADAQRLDDIAVPDDGQRSAIMTPSDTYALLGAQTGLYVQDAAKSAWREAELGRIAGIDTYKTQNMYTWTQGARGGTPLVNGGSQNVTYGSSNSWGSSQNLICDGGSNSITGWAKAGDIFTIAGVYAVNPVTKVTLPFLQQFVVTADANTDGSGNVTLAISPAIISSGAFQTVSAAPADNAALTFSGTAATAYQPSLAFHKNAVALTVVPMEITPGMIDPGRESYKGLSVRVVPYYDGTNDVSNWRLDILYGVTMLDGRLSTRLSG